MNIGISCRMFRRVAGCAIFIAVLSAQCLPQGALPAVCRLSGHCFGIIHELANPVLVRSAEGDVSRLGAIPDQPMRDATVEVFGPGDSMEKHSAETDEHGRFKIVGLPTGDYGFHVWASGFNSVVGRLTISKRALRKNKLHIKMTVGV
jgi:Carboxypeptidase regulatory-like domain